MGLEGHTRCIGDMHVLSACHLPWDGRTEVEALTIPHSLKNSHELPGILMFVLATTPTPATVAHRVKVHRASAHVMSNDRPFRPAGSSLNIHACEPTHTLQLFMSLDCNEMWCCSAPGCSVSRAGVNAWGTKGSLERLFRPNCVHAELLCEPLEGSLHLLCILHMHI